VTAELNHTIVWCQDKVESSAFLVDLLGLKQPVAFGPMLVVKLSNGVSLDYYEKDGNIASQHYAFLVSEDEFDQVFNRIREKKLEYWADPGRERRGEIYRQFGGRGVYFEDPDGHFMEAMTRPYEIGD
jgi:catechol 2,3-dioxygenase-like lactoylglutathione lyase family enzyme